jgi:hypothetical protein
VPQTAVGLIIGKGKTSRDVLAWMAGS